MIIDTILTPDYEKLKRHCIRHSFKDMMICFAGIRIGRISKFSDSLVFRCISGLGIEALEYVSGFMSHCLDNKGTLNKSIVFKQATYYWFVNEVYKNEELIGTIGDYPWHFNFDKPVELSRDELFSVIHYMKNEAI